MSKVRQKISGTLRNMDSLTDFCRIRSFVSCAQKQGMDVFRALVGLGASNSVDFLFDS